MSTALSAIKPQTPRSEQGPAGQGASLAILCMTRDVLPPIVTELEARIASLEERIRWLERYVYPPPQ